MMILVKRPFIVPRDPGPESGVDKEGVSGCCFRLRGRSTSTSTQHKQKHKAARSLSTVTGGNSVGAVAIVQAGKQWPFVLSVTRWRTLAVVVDTCPRHKGWRGHRWGLEGKHGDHTIVQGTAGTRGSAPRLERRWQTYVLICRRL